MDIGITEQQAKVISKLDYTNEGNAEAFLEVYGGAFHYNKQIGWLIWTGTHWANKEAEAGVKRALLNVLRMRRMIGARENIDAKFYKRIMGEKGEVMGAMFMLQAMPSVYLEFEDFDNDTGMLNCQNGVVDLRTGNIIPHNQNQKFTYCLATAYKKNANCDLWLGFLEGVGISQDMRQYLQKAVGYSITGETSEEIMFYIYGKPRSGKGTFTEVLELMLGELSSGVNFRTFTSDRHGDTSNFDLAPLKNKRLLTASESSRFKQLNTAVIKQITGGDKIYCSFKRKDHFSYRPGFVVWLTSNWPLNADVDDDAAHGRIKVVHFPNCFLGNEDKTLKPRLKEQASLEGVLSWTISGAVAWYSSLPEGLKEPAEVTEIGKAHRYELDSVGQFLDDSCIIKEGVTSEGQLFYKEYKQWCEDEGHNPRVRKMFTQSLAQRGIPCKQKKVGGVNKRRYIGVGLLAEL